jgi:hypothetical protein
MVAPLVIPYNHFATVSYDLRRYMAHNALYGGGTQVMELAEPRWVANYRTALLSEQQRREFKLFWDRMKGGQVPFLGYDPSQPVPLAYHYTGLPSGFPGITNISALHADGFTMYGLPNPFTLTPGDLVELFQGDNHAVFRVVTATVPSTDIALTVIPRVPLDIFTAPFGNVLRPACNMIVDPGSWSHAAEAGTLTPASFSAIQKIR